MKRWVTDPCAGRSREEEPPPPRKSDRDLRRERELEEEAKERKKLDRKARDKEAAYQVRRDGKSLLVHPGVNACGFGLCG